MRESRVNALYIQLVHPGSQLNKVDIIKTVRWRETFARICVYKYIFVELFPFQVALGWVHRYKADASKYNVYFKVTI